MASLNELEIADLSRQNVYLKLRNEQLQRDVVNLQAEALRLRQELERREGRGVSSQPNLVRGDP